MATITIKGLPEELHRQLKEHAKENGRSLNQEIVRLLRMSATLVPRQDIEAETARVRELRRQQRADGFSTTPEEIERFIREGRE